MSSRRGNDINFDELYSLKVSILVNLTPIIGWYGSNMWGYLLLTWKL